jgi:AcrR family transcriptional regulator
MSSFRTDPRKQRSRAAALEAAAELLAEGGPALVTHAAVAERAGVGRATVYRHWPQQQALLVDALASSAGPLRLQVGEGSVRDQLVGQLTAAIGWFNQPIAAAVTAALIDQAERDPEMDRMRQRLYGAGVQMLRSALRAAGESGDLRPGAEEHAEVLLARIMGPLFFHRFLLGQALDEEFVVRSVDSALAAWLPYT